MLAVCFVRFILDAEIHFLFNMNQIPGFRPGKIPESILLNYVGEESVQKATVESILKRTLPHAMSTVCLLMIGPVWSGYCSRALA